jgi:hypothetical protein
MVIFTTWNDLGEHHYVGPYNLVRDFWDPYNAHPHLAYLELSSYFIEWYVGMLSTSVPCSSIHNCDSHALR